MKIGIYQDSVVEGIHIWIDGTIHIDRKKWNIERDRTNGTYHIYANKDTFIMNRKEFEDCFEKIFTELDKLEKAYSQPEITSPLNQAYQLIVIDQLRGAVKELERIREKKEVEK